MKKYIEKTIQVAGILAAVPFALSAIYCAWALLIYLIMGKVILPV